MEMVMKHVFFWLMVGSLFLPSALFANDPVLALSVDGIINPVISDYVVKGIKRAEETKAAAVLIELNTPGGLLDATRSMISAMLNTDLPVILYVTPRGSRATSAGVFLMMAADVAAMSKETHIGAAHPVQIGDDAPSIPSQMKKSSAPSSVMEEKMVSDAAALIRSLAKEHGRNAEWAERAVRESVSLTAEEALDQKVIDLMADSREQVLSALTGKKIIKNNKTLTLNLQGSAINEFPMSALQKFLQRLGHPNVAYILLTIGLYGLIYEFATPGHGIGGVLAALSLLLAFFSLQILPINMVGAILLVIGAVLLVTELFTPTHGVLAGGGVLAFAVGSFLLIDIIPGSGVRRVSLELILPTALVTGFFFAFIVRKLLAIRNVKSTVGAESLIGLIGEVRERISPQGLVHVNGELWIAKADTVIEPQEKVTVIEVQGNLLIVKKV